MSKILIPACVAACLIWLTSGFHSGNWQLMDVTGHLPALKFSLINDSSRAVTEKDYRGKVILLYFGFTGCSAQCPVMMAHLSEALQQLGRDSDQVRVLFVTINPANDTPYALRHYLAAFDSRHMTGLTGSENDIRTLAQRLRAAYRPAPAGDIPHSNVIYIFDQLGMARLLSAPEDADNKLVHDVEQLVHGAG